MKTFIASLIMAMICITGYGQQFSQYNAVPDYLKKIDTPRVYHNTIKQPPIRRFTKDKLNNDTSSFAKAPLMIFRSKTTGKIQRSIFSMLSFMRQEDISSMEILPDKKADSLYGTQGKNGVIIIEPIATAKIYTINEYLDYHQIPKKDRNLPVYLDYNMLPNLSGKFVLEGDTKSVTVETDPAGKKYISILSNQYPNQRVHFYNDKEEHEQMARGKN